MNSNAIRDDYGFRLARAPGHASGLTATLLAIVPRRRMAAMLGGVALSLALVAPASAVANVGRFTETTVFTDTATDDCRGVTGTLAGTDVLTYQTVDTDQGSHFEGTDAATLTFTFTDGSYATAQSVDHLSFESRPNTLLVLVKDPAALLELMIP
jgi:hypothetical protein